ncbi:phage head closure protein [Granulicella tundricola]|uniref:Phage head-tail adaptor n=1 Tax=Granulicella tundricola (strain ATCC BAA-1859 / DSM 23138 / MP5ACTX9) TaxID=1198114 RepID=E8X0Q9_GRATM|nr:phage head closure protein [Granulicella tundricola]ADW69010.1 phage head-tail adaptor [Granulicella tundricola MP5ACTX9]
MNAGTLNRRIQIQSQSETRDQAGQKSTLWDTTYQCWASIDVQQSQLIYSTAEFIGNTTYRITCRYTSSVVFQPNQRIVYTEPTTGVVHLYEIQAILNDKQANKLFIFMCYELNGEG